VLRRLFALVPSLALLVLAFAPVTYAASRGGDYAPMGVDMVLLAVILAAIFLWIYSVVA
jgi:VIT1/CCC1 family predicted Fe2+/Mn2+ transporter